MTYLLIQLEASSVLTGSPWRCGIVVIRETSNQLRLKKNITDE